MTWRRSLRAVVDNPESFSSIADTLKFHDVCLFKSLQRLGVPIVPSRSGPFWAMRDGNAFLAEHDLQLLFTSERPLRNGKYIMWTPPRSANGSVGHFDAVIRGESTRLVEDDGELKDRKRLNYLYMGCQRTCAFESIFCVCAFEYLTACRVKQPEDSLQTFILIEVWNLISKQTNTRIHIAIPAGDRGERLCKVLFAVLRRKTAARGRFGCGGWW